MGLFGRTKEGSGEKPDRGNALGLGGGFDKGWVLSAVFLVVVALMAAGVFIGRSLGGDEESAQPPANPSAASSPSGEASPSREAAEPSAPGSSTSAPALGPIPKPKPCPAPKKPGKKDESPGSLGRAPSTTWEPFGGGVMSAPKTAAGPAEAKKDRRRCFAQTPLGALTAAGTLLIANSGTREVARFAMTHQMTPGEDRDEALKRVNAADGIPPESEMSLQVSGYNMHSYSPRQAVVSIAMLFDSGGIVEFKVPMVWADGDWKMRGHGAPIPQPVAGEDSFVPWGAGQ